MAQKWTALKGYEEEKTIITISCGNCGTEKTSEYDTLMNPLGSETSNEFPKEAFDEGWREVDSDEYGAILAFCPECVEAKCKLKNKIK